MVCHVNMITFRMTLLMNKRTNLVMDDGWVHPMAKTLPSLVRNLWQNIVMDAWNFGWKVTSWVTKIATLELYLQGMTNNIGLRLHFKHSHWWKRRSRSKFASHYTWRTNGVCKCKMDVKSTWIPTWHEKIHVSWSLELFFQKPPLGGTPNTKPWDHRTLNAHNRCFILLHHLRGPTWIQNHWKSIWLK
jgi:hypothetical protein